MPKRISDPRKSRLSGAAAPYGKSRLQFGPEVTANRQHRGPTGYEEVVHRCLGKGSFGFQNTGNTHSHAGVRILEKVEEVFLEIRYSSGLGSAPNPVLRTRDPRR
jgi:hypothetical protein